MSLPENELETPSVKVTFAVGAESPSERRSRKQHANPKQLETPPATDLPVLVETSPSNADDDECDDEDHFGSSVESIPLATSAMPEILLSPVSASPPKQRPRRKHPKVHEMFVELFDLKQQVSSDGGNEFEWRETARWMKYEEDVEGVDHHWGRPHVAFLPFHALLQLRKCLQEGVVLLDLEANTFEDICKHIASSMAQKAAKSFGAKMKPPGAKSTPQNLMGPGHSGHYHTPSPLAADMGPSSDTTPCPTTVKENAILNTLTLIGMRHVIDNPLRRITSNAGMIPDERKVSSFLNRKFSRARQVDAEIARHENRNLLAGSGRGSETGSYKKSPSLIRKLTTPFRALSTIQRSGPPSGNGSMVGNRLSPPNGNISASSDGVHLETAIGDVSVPSGGTAAGNSTIVTAGSAIRNKSKASIMNSIANFTDVIEKEQILNRLDVDTEAAQVFVGVVDELSAPRFAMVRLAEALDMPQLIEAPIPIRFLFVILGPQLGDINYHEVGRAIATLMSDRYFHSIAYRASEKKTLLAAMDTFLDMSVVIPPGEIDHKRLISADEIKKVLRRRRKNARIGEEEMLAEEGEEGADGEAKGDGGGGNKKPSSVASSTSPLERKKRLFYGLKEDIKARLPYYWSDIRDAFNFRCLTTIVFMFFASFAPAITFGGLMGSYTDDAMGTTETLMAQCVCGVLWGLFAAQPLLIMSATGPVLIFEASLYVFCRDLGLDFLAVRVWAGAWLLLLALVTVAFEGVVLVRYVSRFTEDIFGTLISIIFIAESFKFVIKTFAQNPVGNLDSYIGRRADCLSGIGYSGPVVYGNGSGTNNGTVVLGCSTENHPNTALLTAILVIGTFSLAYTFRMIRTSIYLSREMRNIIGDFSVAIAIGMVSAVYMVLFSSTYVQALDMPETPDFTSSYSRHDRLFIDALLPADKWWGYLFALLPAFLVYILLFVETEITELLLSKKDKGLTKGRGGFHWDLLLVGALAFLCGLLGLPWMCAAAVQSLAHVGALTVYQRHAPGERPKVDHVVEQRVTTVGVALLVGLCVFGGRYLKVLPLAVLFGVFLYLGVNNLGGVQLVKRIVLFFIPRKYFPDNAYCQKVSTGRMHFYTALQLACLIIVYMVKHFKKTALAFPFVLCLIAILRRVALPRLFTDDELQALDGHDDAEDEDEDNLDLFDLVTVF